MNEHPAETESTSAPAHHLTPQLSDDRLYRALAATRRRRLLALLSAAETRQLDELATALVGWESTDTSTMATPEDREGVLIDLVHVHVPMLVDVGLLKHDRDGDTVSLEPCSDAVLELIRQSVD